ncbi:MAG: oxidoreductase [Salinibacterium sp.]|nr:MAG: oxidoreductase [Salinibacterium sp.]
MSARRRYQWAAVAGMLAALVSLAVAEVLAVVVGAGSSPMFAVGSLAIDLAPPWVKDFVIALFGTGDKIALLVVLGIVVVLLALAVGVLQWRRPPLGNVLLVLVGVVASVAAATRAGATPWWIVPSVIGVIVGTVVLRIGLDRLADWADSDPIHVAIDRRRFLTMLGMTAAGALVVGVAARAYNSANAAIATLRDSVKLPKPATPAPQISAGAELDIPGITPLISSNESFYRIDTALQVPVVDVSTWKLRIIGLVEREVEITFDELLTLPLTERAVTLACVSNEVGGNLIGNAIWLGYPLHKLLERARPLPRADMVLSRSIDGFTASTPLEVLQDPRRDSLLAVGMNGEPLPLEHGFPARLVVPGLYGYVSATKWVTELKVTTFAEDIAYWSYRGWSDHGPIKTESRIDVPASGARVRAGRVAVAGMAWSQHTGISAVEVRIDRGVWQPARLADPISADTWRQWVYEWDAPRGSHLLEVRATDSLGQTQSATQVPPAPNGAEGWHAVTVAVE